MNELIVSLAKARKEVAEKKAQVSLLQEALENSEPYLSLAAAKDSLRELSEIEAKHYRELCQVAVSEYDDQNKRPHPAVGIGEFTVVDYDEDLMKTWAIEHNHPGMLNLNKTAAKKVATGPTAPDFVNVSIEIRAKVASDLSEYAK